MAHRVSLAFAGCGLMTRQASYWIFFVIVAVGLALSWGQIGRKTHRVFEAEPFVFLKAESSCRPGALPCAAVAGDRAVLLGPVPGGLAVRQTGLETADITRVELVALSADGGELGSYLAASRGDAWLVPRLPSNTKVLRVRVIGSRDTSVADFPL